MQANKVLNAFLLLGAALVALPAAANEGMPEVKTMDGIRYTSGGIGDMEREAMQHSAKDYNLRLTFAIGTGQYLADVKVSIQNAKGHKVVDAVADGPWFYAKLAPGKYKVTAEADGQTRTRTITVGKSKAAVAGMVWASPDELTTEGGA